MLSDTHAHTVLIPRNLLATLMLHHDDLLPMPVMAFILNAACVLDLDMQ